MSSNESVNAVNTNPDLKTRAQRLAVDSLAILRKFDIAALVVAVVALFVISGLLDIAAVWGLILAGLTYVGTALVHPHHVKPDPPPPPPLIPEAYTRSRESTARMLTLGKEIPDPAVRRQVRVVPGKFTTMLDVMNDDQRFTSTSDYYTLLVHPFERLLSEYVRLSSRKVPRAEPQLRYFERQVVPRTEKVAEAFYQDYHQDPLIDLVALMEIFGLNLDSLKPDDNDSTVEVEDEADLPDFDDSTLEEPAAEADSNARQ